MLTLCLFPLALAIFYFIFVWCSLVMVSQQDLLSIQAIKEIALESGYAASGMVNN